MSRLVGDRLVSRTAVRDADFEGMYVTALLEDREGSIWVATRHGGLHQLRDVPFRAITRRDGLVHDDVLSVFEDHAANLWVGTDGAGLTHLNGGQGVHLDDAGGAAEQRDLDARGDPGRRHVGRHRSAGWRGSSAVDVTSFVGVGGYPPGGIRAILEDRRGNLWIGSNRFGLWRLRGSEMKRFTAEDGPASNSISVLREGPDGTLWIGTFDGGLNRLSGGKFTNYSTEQGLRSNDVTAILCEDQHVWVGTTDGSLHLVRNDRVLQLPTKGGASSGHALQILDDGRGSIWMSGERGITRLERSDLLKVANGNVRGRDRPGLRLPRWLRPLGVPGRLAVVGRASGRRVARLPERHRRHHRSQPGLRQVDRRAVREGDGGARATGGRCRSTAAIWCCRPASSSSRSATPRPA